MNSFLFSGTLASRNYVIRLFAGCANDLVYLDSSEFHVGKKPRQGGEECGNITVFALCIPAKFIVLQCCTMFPEGDFLLSKAVCAMLWDTNCQRMI